MKKLLVCIIGLLCSISYASSFDYTITSGFTSGFFKITNESLLVEGGGIENIQAYENSYVKVTGTDAYVYQNSGIRTITLKDDSSLDLYDGEIGKGIDAYDSSSINIYGGSIESLTAMGASTINIYGGNISVIDTAQYVLFDDSFEITIVCYDWAWDDDNNILSGYWEDGSILSIELPDSIWEDGSAYSLYEHVTIVPEPCSLVLLGLGGLLIRRK